MDDATRLTRLAEATAALVEDGMLLGLGSGSTAEATVRALGSRVAAGLRITGVPTSARTERLARELGIPLCQLDEVDRLDLGIDGADEIAPNLDVVKGRGGALLYEKLVALTCERFLIVSASEKLVERLGTRMPLPVEVVPFGWKQTARRLGEIGCRATLRRVSDGAPFISDGGHYVLDCATGPIADPLDLAASIKALTGVVDHGLFPGFADRAMVVDPDGTVRTLTRD
ncbi:MAG: ribose 5-phosphate isomerase [Thermomicrobiales bacterium]|nr:ribose 5-phosphate isomerase [Thermomicrobiales bacterium]